MHKFNLILDIRRDSRNARSYPSVRIPLKTIFCFFLPKKKISIWSLSFLPSFYLSLVSIFSLKYWTDFAARWLKLLAALRLFTCRGRRKLLATAEISKDSLRCFPLKDIYIYIVDIIRNSWYFIVISPSFNFYCCLAEIFTFFACELHLNCISNDKNFWKSQF